MHEKPQNLNESQWQAVIHQGSHLLIVAGPGTGKTHTITHRIAHLIPTLKADEKILAITFTNKAARQMKDRLTALGVPQSKAFIGTFHSFCLKLLRDFWQDTALPKDFKIILEEDVEGFDKKVLERISLMKSIELVLNLDEDYKNYQRYLRQNGLIDFDDILREALMLLENETIAQKIRAQYKYIFVDEYQDCNIVQNALLKNLIVDGVGLTAIGDPHQSIYGFRGSNVELFHRFQNDFPDALILKLQDNYRSAANLIAASSQVMDGVELLAKMNTQGHLATHEAATDMAEADYIARQIEKMVGGMDMISARTAHRSFGDIAILYRLNSQRHVICQALDHFSIPYQVSKKPSKPEQYSDEEMLGQWEEELDYQIEKVSLLTLHAAKGLEFPVVFIVGCEDKILPMDLAGMKSNVDEERRLFYVGMTRAKEQLYLTFSKRRQMFGKTLFNAPSPFLADISEELKVFEAAKRKAIKKDPDAAQMKLF